MIFHRCLILGTILTMAVMLFAGSCAGRPGTTTDHRTQVGPSSDLKNHEVRQTFQPASYVPGEVLVRFVEDTDKETISAMEMNYHVTVKKVLIPSRLYLMKITDGSTVQNLIDRLRNNKAIEYAEPNYIRQTR